MRKLAAFAIVLVTATVPAAPGESMSTFSRIIDRLCRQLMEVPGSRP